jgi:hypothetical protein
MPDYVAARPFGSEPVSAAVRRPAAGGRVLSAALAAVLLVPAGQALAQAVPPPAPVGAQPPTREEIERGVAEGTLNKSGPVAVDTSAVERAPCPLSSPDFAGIRLKLSSVTFAGMDKLPGVDLSDSYREYVGTDQPVSIICDIRDRAATKLRGAGYLAAVQVPPQKITDGNVRLDVLLAHLSRIQIKGDAGASEGALLRYLNKLTAEPVFNTYQAERYLLLAKDVPGLDVRLALRPVDGAPGEVIGEVSVRRTPVYADFSVQNFGSKAVGRFNGLLRAVQRADGAGRYHHSQLLRHARIPRTESAADRARDAAGRRRLHAARGFHLCLDQSHHRGASQFHSRTLVASLEARYPLVRRQAFNLSASGGLDLINQQVDFGAIRFNEDRLRVAFVRLDLNGLSRQSLLGRDGFTPMNRTGTGAVGRGAARPVDPRRHEELRRPVAGGLRRGHAQPVQRRSRRVADPRFGRIRLSPGPQCHDRGGAARAIRVRQPAVLRTVLRRQLHRSGAV